MQIRSIDGMGLAEINKFVKRNLSDSFTKKYIIHQEDIEAMNETPQIGLDASERDICCSNCREKIGGYLDFTNFDK